MLSGKYVAPAMMCVFDKVQSPIGKSLFTFCLPLIRVCISFSANQAKEKKFSYMEKFEADKPNSF